MKAKTLILGLGLAVMGSMATATAQTTFTPANPNMKVKTMQMKKHDRVVKAHNNTDLKTAADARLRTANKRKGATVAKKAKLTKSDKMEMRMERKALHLRHKQTRMSTIK